MTATAEPEVRVATFATDDGVLMDEQVLVTRWPDGSVSVARRPSRLHLWSPPVGAEVVE